MPEVVLDAVSPFACGSQRSDDFRRQFECEQSLRWRNIAGEVTPNPGMLSGTRPTTGRSQSPSAEGRRKSAIRAESVISIQDSEGALRAQ